MQGTMGWQKAAPVPLRANLHNKRVVSVRGSSTAPGTRLFWGVMGIDCAWSDIGYGNKKNGQKGLFVLLEGTELQRISALASLSFAWHDGREESSPVQACY